MEVIFKKSNNAPNEYPKTFATNTITKDCDLLEPTSTKTPIIKLAKDITIIGYTHAIIWGDVYELENDINYDKGFMYIRCRRSALDTWWNTVKNSNAHITRSSDSGDRFMVDNLAVQTKRISWSCIDLGSAFTSGSAYILVKGVTG